MCGGCWGRGSDTEGVGSCRERRESVSEVFFSPHPGLSSFESPATGWRRGCTLSPLRGQEGQIAIGNRESGIFPPWARLKSGSSKDDVDRSFEVGPGLPE